MFPITRLRKAFVCWISDYEIDMKKLLKKMDPVKYRYARVNAILPFSDKTIDKKKNKSETTDDKAFGVVVGYVTEIVMTAGFDLIYTSSDDPESCITEDGKLNVRRSE